MYMCVHASVCVCVLIRCAAQICTKLCVTVYTMSHGYMRGRSPFPKGITGREVFRKEVRACLRPLTTVIFVVEVFSLHGAK